MKTENPAVRRRASQPPPSVGQQTEEKLILRSVKKQRNIDVLT